MWEFCIFTKFFTILILSFIGFINGTPINIPQNASQYESPWLALIKIGLDRCGGSLFNNKYIITAAHCFDEIENLSDSDNLEKIEVILGEWKTETDPDCEEGIDDMSCIRSAKIPVKKVIIHNKYLSQKLSLRKFENDIAIIKLKWEPRLSEIIQNVELPEANRCSQTNQGENWKFTGFGQIQSDVYTTIKKKISMKIITNDKCKSYLRDNEKILLKSTHICGRSKGPSTCKGDSGSAATMSDGVNTYLEGIVSFGTAKCETQNFPTSFIRVSCFVNWITEQIKYLVDEDKTSSEEDENSEEDYGNNNDDISEEY